MYLNSTLNEHGVKVSVHKCDTCNTEFTVCPGVDKDSTSFNDCLSLDCSSYDPERDIEIVFMDDNEISRERDIVSINMLRKRKQFRLGKDVFNG